MDWAVDGPYEFQVIATVRKNPTTEGIKIAWDPKVENYDVLIPLWNPWAQEPASRSSAPDWYQVQLDEKNHFHSGRKGAAPEFGATFLTPIRQSVAQGRVPDISHFVPSRESARLVAGQYGGRSLAKHFAPSLRPK